MNRIQKKIIEDALDQQELLTDWEMGFIDSIAEEDDDYELSFAQNRIVNRIGSKLR